MLGRCLLCNSHSPSAICQKCDREILLSIHSRHEHERKIPGTEIPLISFSSYQGKIRQIIQIAKSQYIEKSALLDSWLYLAAQRLAESLQDEPNRLIVPLPERRNGFDSRRRLAKDLAFLLGSQLSAPIHHDLLRHDGWWFRWFGKTQKEKNRWQRLTQAPRYKIAQTHLPRAATKIILVDDICTTGGTFRAAAKPLLEAGFEISAAVSLADTPRQY